MLHYAWVIAAASRPAPTNMSKSLFYIILATLLVLAAATAVGTGGASDNDQEAELAPAQSEFDARSAIQLIYAGRSDSTLAIVAREEQANPYDPLVLIVKARAMRDQLADEDIDKDIISEDNKPIHGVLDRTIELCDDAIDRKASDPIYHYYKGRAHLAKAQLHTLAREYWSAGGASRAAKKHLEKYLEYRPDDPDAQGDLGAFLYFADTLPGVVKFLSKLLMLPGGDRDRGLRMLDYASTHNGVFETDHKITVAAINLLFEGKIRDGADQMLRLSERYPYYTRLLEPLGVLAPLDPLRLGELMVTHDEAVARHRTSGKVRFDDSLVKRMTCTVTTQSFSSDRRPMQCPASMRWLQDPPYRPDWAQPLLALNQAIFLAMDGQLEAAQRDYDMVLAEDRFKHFHDIANKMSQVNDSDNARRAIADLGWINDIYRGNPRDAATGLKAYEAKYGRDPLHAFYSGEIALFAQDFELARRYYEACINANTGGADEYYQFWSTLRLAEIHGHQFRYEEARKLYEKSREYKRVTYLLDFMMNSRVRYYSLLEDGKIDGPPRLLFYHVYEPSTTLDDARSDASN